MYVRVWRKQNIMLQLIVHVLYIDLRPGRAVKIENA